MSLTLTPSLGIAMAVLAGVALVLPACLGGERRRWAVAALLALVALAAPVGSGPAVAAALAWPTVVLAQLATALRAAGPVRSWTRRDVVHLVASVDALVAGCWFVLSRAGASPLGIHEPIVALTAVHFTYAGAAAVTLAGAAADAAPTRRALGTGAVALSAAAPALVASGFVTRSAVAQVGGAVVMTLGVWATAGMQLAEAHRTGPRVARLLLAVSALSVWAPMVLAVAWAAAQHAEVAALSIPDMIPTHGGLNAVGFVGCGLLARWVQRRPAADRTPRVRSPQVRPMSATP
ncbi:YndJ family transporter [Iamia majanohamensis]|uniref:YndJ family transporter n=1 Tax=Iamia majanohamensis TaxID=467976 RepID=A0AAF0BX25_9ACTN|nr:YndJ family transporter [Iamia majanohamensis]WCO68124.1 YndJ family transporter [Iamia majanohamensis]